MDSNQRALSGQDLATKSLTVNRIHPNGYNLNAMTEDEFAVFTGADLLIAWIPECNRPTVSTPLAGSSLAAVAGASLAPGAAAVLASKRPATDEPVGGRSHD